MAWAEAAQDAKAELAMARKQCEFSLVRYVPDPVKNEFVNIGVLLRETVDDPIAAKVLRFTRDWGRVRCLDPEADIAMLEAVEGEIRGLLVKSRGGNGSISALMDESFSNNIQLTPAKGCEPENLVTGLEQLMQLYVEPRKREGVSRKSGRQLIFGQMRAEFERAGVWELMSKRISAAKYTHPGDSLKIDCGYRPNGTIHLYHAVSLYGDLDSAKVLAFSVPRMREGVERVERAKMEFTAIVEPTVAWGREATGAASQKARAAVDADVEAQYDFARDTLTASDIQVLTINDLARRASALAVEWRV